MFKASLNNKLKCDRREGSLGGEDKFVQRHRGERAATGSRN